MDPTISILDDTTPTKPSAKPFSEGTQSEQHNIELFWDSMLKLEERAERDPAFSKQLAQLRRLAQATMISSDEAVTGRSNSSLMEHIAVLKSSSPSSPTKAEFETEPPGSNSILRVAEFAEGRLNPVPEISLSIANTRVTHVLEYLKYNPSSDRFRLCTEISKGLAHMHGQGVVLGDFAPYNVTVDESGHVQLRQLNLESAPDSRAIRGTWRSRLPDARYIPPEVITLPPEHEGVTDPNPRKSDVPSLDHNAL
ncbi:hypothetical protein BDV93DRAFT_265271 [Ceratobasidium sp. AG-I]|nr:hypothetical protein BDV93DRAFT_265271 [Ceratobasidium sp. AG-I]